MMPRRSTLPVGPDIAPAGGGGGYPVPMRFDVPAAPDQQSDEMGQSLAGIAAAIQQRAMMNANQPLPTMDAPTRRPQFPNPMQADQLNRMVGGYA